MLGSLPEADLGRQHVAAVGVMVNVATGEIGGLGAVQDRAQLPRWPRFLTRGGRPHLAGPRAQYLPAGHSPCP